MKPTPQVSPTRIVVLLLSILGVLAASALMVAASHTQNRDDLDRHCPDHQSSPKIENPTAGSVHKVTVDGTDVWAHFGDDGRSVEFFADEEGTQPIAVEFCMKAGDRAGGKEVGHEGHVSWKNKGGQTPAISYVVVYRVVDDEGECPDDLRLTPQEATNEPGDTHEVTATVTDSNGDPCEDIDVRFEVTPAQDAEPATGTALTDEGGQATFTYTRQNESTDTITACTTEDGDAPAQCDTTEHIHDTAQKTWEEEVTGECPDDLRLTPQNATNEPGDTHEVTATVTDSEGNPCEDIDVRFEVTPAQDAEPATGTALTDADGQATFTYTRQNESTDTITACTTDDGDAPAQCDTDEHIHDTAQKTWEEEVVVEGFWTCEARVIEALGLKLFEANAGQMRCMDDEDSLLHLPLGGDEENPAILLEVARARTQLDDGPSSRAIVAGAVIRDGDGNMVVAAHVLESEAWGSCDDQPSLDSRSSVARVGLLDEEAINVNDETSIDALDDLVGTVHLNNTETEEANGDARVTQRAFWWEGFPLGDIILAEATADHHGNPCN